MIRVLHIYSLILNKCAKPPTIPLSESITARLCSHRKRQLEDRLRLGSSYHNYDLVFANEIGAPIHYRNLTQRYCAKILKDAGLGGKGFVLCSLRHTCATVLLAANENPKVVAERLGYSSVKTTLDTYSHVLPDMQQAPPSSSTCSFSPVPKIWRTKREKGVLSDALSY
jgi:integrase